MYGEGRVSIERAANGYTVNMRDPAIVAQNAKNSAEDRKPGGTYKPYIDPNKEYVFSDFKAMMTFLTANLDKALPKGDYVSAFDTLCAPDD